jgi:hypothetical protein
MSKTILSNPLYYLSKLGTVNSTISNAISASDYFMTTDAYKGNPFCIPGLKQINRISDLEDLRSSICGISVKVSRIPSK